MERIALVAQGLTILVGPHAAAARLEHMYGRDASVAALRPLLGSRRQLWASPAAAGALVDATC